MIRFWNSLTEKWYKYLIAFIVALFCWVIIIDIIVAPKKNERIEIFVGSYGVSNEINDVVDKPPYIEEFIFTDVKINESYYFVLFSSYASSEDVDAFIVKESQFRESDIQYYQKLNENDVKELLGIEEFFKVNNDVYGIKVYDGQTKTGLLAEYIIYDDGESAAEDYYMFFSKYSIHLGGLNNSQYDGIIEFLKKFLLEKGDN